MQLAIWAGDFGGTITPDPSGLIAEDFSNNESAAPNLTFARYEQTSAGSGSRYCTTSVGTNLGAVLVTVGNPDVVDHNELDSIASNISLHALIRPDTIVGGDTIIRKHQAWEDRHRPVEIPLSRRRWRGQNGQWPDSLCRQHLPPRHVGRRYEHQLAGRRS